MGFMEASDRRLLLSEVRGSFGAQGDPAATARPPARPSSRSQQWPRDTTQGPTTRRRSAQPLKQRSAGASCRREHGTRPRGRCPPGIGDHAGDSRGVGEDLDEIVITEHDGVADLRVRGPLGEDSRRILGCDDKKKSVEVGEVLQERSRRLLTGHTRR